MQEQEQQTRLKIESEKQKKFKYLDIMTGNGNEVNPLMYYLIVHMTYLAWNRYSLRKIKGDWKT